MLTKKNGGSSGDGEGERKNGEPNEGVVEVGTCCQVAGLLYLRTNQRGHGP